MAALVMSRGTRATGASSRAPAAARPTKADRPAHGQGGGCRVGSAASDEKERSSRRPRQAHSRGTGWDSEVGCPRRGGVRADTDTRRRELRFRDRFRNRIDATDLATRVPSVGHAGPPLFCNALFVERVAGTRPSDRRRLISAALSFLSAMDLRHPLRSAVTGSTRLRACAAPAAARPSWSSNRGGFVETTRVGMTPEFAGAPTALDHDRASQVS